MLEKIVTSLEVSKKLNEAGFDEDTNFYYEKTNEGYEIDVNKYADNIDVLFDETTEDYYLKAYAFEQILGKLPDSIEGDYFTYHLTIRRDRVSYESVAAYPIFAGGGSLANAGAEAWLWLRENNYI